ncbi:hypothetical protein PT2222_440008 [Paraburkholderia tropica]
MGAWPLDGNLSYYALFRALASDNALSAVALMLTAGMILAVAAIWLWCRRGVDRQMEADSESAETTGLAESEHDGMLDGAGVHRTGHYYRWPTRF